MRARVLSCAAVGLLGLVALPFLFRDGDAGTAVRAEAEAEAERHEPSADATETPAPEARTAREAVVRAAATDSQGFASVLVSVPAAVGLERGDVELGLCTPGVFGELEFPGADEGVVLEPEAVEFLDGTHRFAFLGVPPGAAWQVRVGSGRLLEFDPPGPPGESVSGRFALRAGQERSVSVRAIGGVLFGSLEAPLAALDADVSLWEVEGEPDPLTGRVPMIGHSRVASTSASAAQGFGFEFAEVPPGRYRVCAAAYVGHEVTLYGSLEVRLGPLAAIDVGRLSPEAGSATVRVDAPPGAGLMKVKSLVATESVRRAPYGYRYLVQVVRFDGEEVVLHGLLDSVYRLSLLEHERLDDPHAVTWKGRLPSEEVAVIR